MPKVKTSAPSASEILYNHLIDLQLVIDSAKKMDDEKQMMAEVVWTNDKDAGISQFSLSNRSSERVGKITKRTIEEITQNKKGSTIITSNEQYEVSPASPASSPPPVRRNDKAFTPFVRIPSVKLSEPEVIKTIANMEMAVAEISALAIELVLTQTAKTVEAHNAPKVTEQKVKLGKDMRALRRKKPDEVVAKDMADFQEGVGEILQFAQELYGLTKTPPSPIASSPSGRRTSSPTRGGNSCDIL